MSQSLRISVADDEPDLRDYYRRMLTHLGHQVVSCSSNGLELLNECQRKQPDLVISDIRMPVMDGLEAAEQIAHESPVPLILVSAHHTPETVSRANAVPVSVLLTKPINMSDLSAAIDLAWKRFASS